MADKLSKAREKLAEKILEKFKEKINGEVDELVIGENPENKFFVGKLLTKGEQNNSPYSSDVFIESVGADFYISESEINRAQIKIFPRGEFYYRIYPTLQQQQDAILEEAKALFGVQYNSYAQLLSDYKKNPGKFEKVKIKLVPVYNKISLGSNEFYIYLTPKELLDETGNFGRLNENSDENRSFCQHIDSLKEQINSNDLRYTYVINEKTGISDLESQETFDAFMKKSAKRDVIIHQNWSAYVYASIKKIKDRFLISVALVNDSAVQSNARTHDTNRKDKDKFTIETLFNAGIDITLENAEFAPIVMDYFLDDYKYDKEQKAVGQNCSIVYDKSTNTIKTEHLPTFTQNRLVTNDKLAVAFQDLIDKPIKTLKNIRKEMDKELENWNKDYSERQSQLTDNGKQKMKEEINEFRLEIERFQFGIDILNSYQIVLKSFILMNKAFLNTSKKYNTWRLFQIVFIVSLIPDIVACDEEIMTPEEKEKTTLSDVSLLYFPTGGGKTEAFLGVLVFNLFFDRFRDKNCGVTAILRYPLRLLSVQQVQRLANTLAQAELLRREDPLISSSSEFSLGYFVGDNNTPNQIREKQVLEYRIMTQDEIDESRILDICPFCGQHSVHLKFDEECYRLIHFCSNEKCLSGGVLPIYMVDTEIYRYLPSAIISTVDKMAILGINRNFRNILSGCSVKCPKHGFTSVRKCLVNVGNKKNCDVEVQDFQETAMRDPAPTLFIQDELHLIRESLGTYASHYESFIDYFVKNISPSKRKIKIIGATATISSYQEQIYQLYGRNPICFPCASPYLDHNFYSYIDNDDTQRFVLGYAPYGKAIATSVVYSLKYMREVIDDYCKHPEKVLNIPGIGINSRDEVLKILEDYWIFLEYNNVKRDGNIIEGALDSPINDELAKEGIAQFETRKMTGDETFQDVREVLADVENSKDVFKGLNLIVATSMISHGVDADRFNIMFFYGIPGNTAEYVQAYSRTGRQYSSIVVDIIRPSRETDQSYLRNFVKFHEYKDIMIEAVPINKWAKKAIDSTLPGIFAGLLLNQYDQEIQFIINGSLYFMSNIKKAIQRGLLEKNIILEQLLQSYGCKVDDNSVELGNQYRKKIERFVDNIFAEILDYNWTDESIIDGFNNMNYHIMSSLRDTDEQLIIALE